MNMKATIQGLFVLLTIVASIEQVHGQYDRLFQVSHLYPKGLYEVHVFNNLFTREVKIDGSEVYNQRESFFTSWGQYTYGLSEKVNIGLDLRFRSVIKTVNSNGHFFDALKFQGGGNFDEGDVTGYRRVDLTNLGLRVKYQPIDWMPNLSIEHILFLPLGNDLEGNDETGFADWQAGVIWNRFFIDQMIGSNFLLFTSMNLLFEDIAVPFTDEDAYYQYGFPITVIGTYIVNQKTFVYGLLESAPIWGTSQNNGERDTQFTPYSQIGIGAKYFIQPWLQTELLVTRFSDRTPESRTWNLNFGLRFFGLTKKARKEYDGIH